MYMIVLRSKHVARRYDREVLWLVRERCADGDDRSMAMCGASAPLCNSAYLSVSPGLLDSARPTRCARSEKAPLETPDQTPGRHAPGRPVPRKIVVRPSKRATIN